MKDWAIYIVIVFLCVVLFIVLLILGLKKNNDSPVTHYDNIFADIDSDGDMDLVISADIIINGSTNFLQTENESDDIINDVNESVCTDKEITVVLTIFKEVEEPLMTSGEPYSNWHGRAARCPEWMEYGTKLTLPGGEEFACMDHSPALYYRALDPGVEHISLLIDSLPVPLGTEITMDMECAE